MKHKNHMPKSNPSQKDFGAGAHMTPAMEKMMGGSKKAGKKPKGGGGKRRV